MDSYYADSYRPKTWEGQPTTKSGVRKWRKTLLPQGGSWKHPNRSRCGCFGRFLCCTLLTFVFFVLSIILSLALWLRPPNVIIGQPTPDLGSFAINNSRIGFNLPVDISVNNPNYFSVTLYNLDARVIYPINDTQIGSGHTENVPFKDHTQTNFTFPVTIAYDADTDPSGAVLLDLARHCGLDPNVAPSDVTVTVNIQIGIKVMEFKFPSPISISQRASFACPLGDDASELQQLLQALGLDFNAISALLN